MFLCGSLWNKKEWGIGGGVVISTQCEFVSFDFHKKTPPAQPLCEGGVFEDM